MSGQGSSPLAKARRLPQFKNSVQKAAGRASEECHFVGKEVARQQEQRRQGKLDAPSSGGEPALIHDMTGHRVAGGDQSPCPGTLEMVKMSSHIVEEKASDHCEVEVRRIRE